MYRATLSTPLGLLLSSRAVGNINAAELGVDVTGVESANGEVFAALYDKADTWLKKPLKNDIVAATKGTTLIVFADLPAGEYALSVFHDTDADKKMGRNILGVPTEPFGFSRDASGVFGSPKFDEARVAVPAAGATTTIKLKR